MFFYDFLHQSIFVFPRVTYVLSVGNLNNILMAVLFVHIDWNLITKWEEGKGLMELLCVNLAVFWVVW